MRKVFAIKGRRIAQVPTEEKWFEVNPLKIDQNLFIKERDKPREEEIRQLILEAFEEMKKKPRYAKPFKTMIPEKSWKSKTIKQLKRLAKLRGTNIADWVNQSLEWAQRIANGESWDNICEDYDESNWFRLVVWKEGRFCHIGGSLKKYCFSPACEIFMLDPDCNENITISNVVPLIYKKKFLFFF